MGEYIKVLLAFLFVVGLIGLLSYLLRKFSTFPLLFKNNPETKKNLSIIEMLPLDSKRRLVLVKNGSKKHLLLLGGGNDILVESADE